MRSCAPWKSASLVLTFVAMAALGACTAREVRDTAARSGLAVIRGACHASGNCGVSCPEGTTLNEPTLRCTPAPP